MAKKKKTDTLQHLIEETTKLPADASRSDVFRHISQKTNNTKLVDKVVKLWDRGQNESTTSDSKSKNNV